MSELNRRSGGSDDPAPPSNDKASTDQPGGPNAPDANADAGTRHPGRPGRDASPHGATMRDIANAMKQFEAEAGQQRAPRDDRGSRQGSQDTGDRTDTRQQSRETAAGSPEAEGVNQESAWNNDTTNEIPDTDSRTTDSRQTSTSETGEPSRDGSPSSDSAWNDPQSNEISDADHRPDTGVERTSTAPEAGREHDTASASSDTPNRSTEDAGADSSTPDTHHPGTDPPTGDQPDPVNEAAGPQSQSRFDRGTAAREAPADQTVGARDEAPGAEDRAGDQTDSATDSRGEHPYGNVPDTYAESELAGLHARAESDRRDIENLNDSDQSGDAQPAGTGHTPSPSDHPANDDPPAPTDTPASGDHNGDREDNGDDPKNPPDLPQEPEHDKPEEAADADALRAENTDLRKQLAEAHATNDRLETTCGYLDNERKDANAKAENAEARADALTGEVTELRGTVTELSGTVSDQNEQIAGLTGKVDEMSGMLGDVLARMNGPEQRNLPDRNEYADNQRPEVPYPGDIVGSSPAGERLNLDDRSDAKGGSRWSIHRGPADRTLNLLQNATVGGLTAGAYELAAGQQHALGWAAWGIGLGVSGIAWIRGRLKDKKKE